MSRPVMSFLMALAVFFIAVLPPTSAEQGTGFSDVSREHWAFDAITWGVGKKVLDGFSDGTFAPEKPVTEAEFLKILISSYESLSGKGGSWYDKYYAYAYEKIGL
ncbi:MAG TPA: S-layer homology domain-containing protein [Paenibacillus sp.]|uniref:S-layer homology domain-containing protein n=1 Tax=Paenibacillus sp. TaxID=58172 RepID=UPI002C3EE0F0|nr:S-layer homology domain-containing protein [Paenibacillus sp.]HUC94019.1 S-layer homology domain-containing protein [Paenibacillus sp.]